MKTKRLTYSICLGVFSIAILGAVLNSILNYDVVTSTFETLGYPSYLIHVSGLAQIIGLILIIFNKNHWSVEWAFAGFFMNFTLGCIAHLAANHGNGATAVICLILLGVTYIQRKRFHESKKEIQSTIEPELA